MSRYDDLKLQILRAIYEDAFRPGSLPAFTMDNIGRVLPPELIFGLTQAILDDLHNEDHLYRDSDGYYGLAIGGIKYIEFIFGDIASQGDNVPEASEADLSEDTAVPAADRLVTLNHNSDPYREAISALDAAVTAFREDHRLENEWGPEKEVLLRSIEGGQRLLKEVEVRVRSLITTTIEPLRIVADRYHDAIAAGLIKASFDQVIPSMERAITALLRLIGLL